MIIPENTAEARLRHNLAVSGAKQKDLAQALGVSNARVSQMIRETAFKLRQLDVLETLVPGFTVQYYLRGEHPAHELTPLPMEAFTTVLPEVKGLVAQMIGRQARGAPTSTLLVVRGEVVRVMLTRGGVLVDRSLYLPSTF